MAPAFPLQITFRGMQHSDALAQRIADKLGKLRRLEPRILAGRVIVEVLPVAGKGARFTVHVRLTLPGTELVATHDADPDATHDNAYVALRDAVDAIARQLRVHSGRRQAHRSGPFPALQ